MNFQIKCHEYNKKIAPVNSIFIFLLGTRLGFMGTMDFNETLSMDTQGHDISSYKKSSKSVKAFLR